VRIRAPLQANKIIGISVEAAAFLHEYF